MGEGAEDGGAPREAPYSFFPFTGESPRSWRGCRPEDGGGRVASNLPALQRAKPAVNCRSLFSSGKHIPIGVRVVARAAVGADALGFLLRQGLLERFRRP